jgi:hypothetical protein
VGKSNKKEQEAKMKSRVPVHYINKKGLVGVYKHHRIDI